MSNRKSIHFTSDWHIGHANSIDFDKRPFRDLDHMHRTLINNYNAQVPKDGVCYFLGDVGMTNQKTITEVISQLNGTKILVLGNHDKGHNAMYNVGFSLVLNGAMLYIAGQRVTLSHCPLRGIFRESAVKHPGEMWHGEFKHLPYSFNNEGQFHLHGHIHSGPANDKLKIDGRQFDVGAPANKYRPVSMSQIESWISTTK